MKGTLALIIMLLSAPALAEVEFIGENSVNVDILCGRGRDDGYTQAQLTLIVRGTSARIFEGGYEADQGSVEKTDTGFEVINASRSEYFFVLDREQSSVTMFHVGIFLQGPAKVTEAMPCNWSTKR
ncbi:hypothetical protein [Dokdonella sp.]|uniref:hypothetical protein n=1 Tax=Dokdonella sp. TaxID=2291710 RepID=UPI003528D8F7